MKEMLEKICKSCILTSLETIDPKTLNTRKKVIIYSGVDLQHYYHIIFHSEQKSRFILKHAQEIITLESLLELHVKHIYKYKHLLVSGSICSKAIAFLKDNGWKVTQ
ncbi:MAG: hypothetical protein PHF52_10395 [Sulfurospirillaceae bacterium]|jgi:hypothetical protein|nr:hypothetical protein [Sulfurospirillaceae bacterium]